MKSRAMNQNQNNRVALYVRVSSEMQVDGYSLDAQESICQSFASLRGWQIVKTYREEGSSASTMERPQFQQMLHDAERGLFDIVMVHKLDRFSRQLKDMIQIIDLFDELDVALVSATEQFDLSTPAGRMQANILGSVAQWYRDNLSQEVIKGKRQRAKSGDWNGTLSYGYTTPSRLRDMRENADDETLATIHETLARYPDAHDTMAIPCPFNRMAVSIAFTEYATGKYSFQKLADLLNESGYRCESRDGTGLFSKDMISELLRNRFYIGETSYGAKVKGQSRKWMEGNHDAIISRALFDKVQELRSTVAIKNKATNRARPYPLSGILYELDTGVKWRGRYRKNRREYVREKFEDIPSTSIEAETLEQQVLVVCSGITVPDDWHKRIMASLVDDEPQDDVNHYGLMQRLERLKTLFLLGDITEDEYMMQRSEIQSILKPKQASINMDDMNEIAEIMKNLSNIWQVATLEEKDELMQLLFHRVYVYKKSVVAVEASEMLSHLVQLQPQTAMRGGQVSYTYGGHVLRHGAVRVRFRDAFLAS